MLTTATYRYIRHDIKYSSYNVLYMYIIYTYETTPFNSSYVKLGGPTTSANCTSNPHHTGVVEGKTMSGTVTRGILWAPPHSTPHPTGGGGRHQVDHYEWFGEGMGSWALRPRTHIYIYTYMHIHVYIYNKCKFMYVTNTYTYICILHTYICPL